MTNDIMHRQSRKLMAIPQPTGYARSTEWIGRGYIRLAASTSRVANRTRHAYPARRSMVASAADIKGPANENGRCALAMNVSRTIGAGRTHRVVLSGTGSGTGKQRTYCRPEQQVPVT